MSSGPRRKVCENLLGDEIRSQHMGNDSCPTDSLTTRRMPERVGGWEGSAGKEKVVNCLGEWERLKVKEPRVKFL